MNIFFFTNQNVSIMFYFLLSTSVSADHPVIDAREAGAVVKRSLYLYDNESYYVATTDNADVIQGLDDLGWKHISEEDFGLMTQVGSRS